MQTGTQKAQLGIVGNLSYQFTPSQRLSFENFYTHSGRDEGRFFEGINLDNAREYRNYRLQFIEEGLMANAVGGEHFFQGLSNSRLDWRVNFARATRDEPDLRETLYERLAAARAADRPVHATPTNRRAASACSTTLDDDTVDAACNWSVFERRGRPADAVQVRRQLRRARRATSSRAASTSFRSRRRRPTPATCSSTPLLPPEELFASSNIGTAFRFNEETRPTDAYDGDQTTTSGYGMVDIALTRRHAADRRRARRALRPDGHDAGSVRPVRARGAGRRTRTPMSSRRSTSCRRVGANSNLRLSYSTTVNRPEFRELAEFEFTDVVGNRAVKGNADLKRALIQNVDARWEMFSGGRGVVAASVFYKHFDKPIERVVIAAAQPDRHVPELGPRAATSASSSRRGSSSARHFFVNANYTFVDSKITLLPEQLGVQTSLERPLAGQSKNLFNLTGEFALGGFSTRLLFNYFGDRISDVGANEAPDIIEQGRGSLDLVFAQRIRGLGVRLTLENLTDSDYLFTQTLTTRRDAAALQAGPDRRAVVRLQRVLRPT